MSVSNSEVERLVRLARNAWHKPASNPMDAWRAAVLAVLRDPVVAFGIRNGEAWMSASEAEDWVGVSLTALAAELRDQEP